MVMKVRPPLPPPPPPAAAAAAAGAMEEAKKRSGNGEVDFSAPFRSVKEAVDRFGGSAAPWRPQPCPSLLLSPQDVELMKLEEQTVKLEMDLFLKERETLNVLKELEMTKKIADSLKSHFQSEASHIIEEPERCSVIVNQCFSCNTQDKCLIYLDNHKGLKDQTLDQKQTPSLILRELNQAKLYLNKTTSTLGGSQSSVELLQRAIENEKDLLRKTRERLNSNIGQISSLEQEIDTTLKKIELIKDRKSKGYQTPSEVLGRMKELRSETEKSKRITGAAKTEMSKLSLDIQQTKSSIKTAEVRLIAAVKVEEAARSAEATALSEIKAQTDVKDTKKALKNVHKVALTVEEYATLIKKAQEADEILRRKMETVMVDLNEAEHSKIELLEKVEEANADVETSRKALQEALRKEEVSNRVKVAAQEALRKWRSQHDRMRRSYLTNAKFKNSSTPQQRRSWILDVNGLSMSTAGPSNVMDKPTLSIGQILSRKLTGHEEHESRALQIIGGKPKVSLRQMLSRKDDFLSPATIYDAGAQKQFFTKKKKRLSVLVLSILLAKQRKKQQQQKSSSSPTSFSGKNT